MAATDRHKVFPVARTRHIHKRMNQRGIQSGMLEAVEQFGVWDGDHLVLNRRSCAAAVKELDKLRKELLRLETRGGVVLVEDGGAQVTTYALDSYKRRKH